MPSRISARRRLLGTVVVVPLLALLTACGGDDDEESEEQEALGRANATCESSIEETASTPVPDDVPTPEGAADPYEYFNQGATKVWFYALDGSPDELVEQRDAYAAQLEDEGYEIEGTDAEPPAEAEAEFGGPHEGTIKLSPLCKDTLELRLKLTS